MKVTELKEMPINDLVQVIPNRSINVLVSDDELAKRRAEQDALGWKPAQPRKRKVSAALRAYAKLVMSADKGAVRDLSLLED